jgi:glutathione S-transferase
MRSFRAAARNEPEETALKIYHAAASPFVRKCLVAAHEVGLHARIELVPAAAHPVNRDKAIVAHNPLGKIPTLVTDDGQDLFDSRVICEYLNAQGRGNLIPREGRARWSVLVDQSLADGIMDAAVLVRYETFARPEALRWNDWITGQLEKVTSGLDALEARASGFGARVDLGTIAFGCALGYLDFRFSALNWRDKRPNAAEWFDGFDARSSMVATRPPAP